MPHHFIQPALMLRQLWLLAALSGIFATRFFLPSLVCFLLVSVHQHKRIFALGPKRAAIFLCGCLVCFTLGAGWALWRHEPLPQLPDWAEEAASPTPHQLALGRAVPDSLPKIWDVADNRIFDSTEALDKQRAYRKGLRLRARVMETQGRADRSLRLMLSHIKPLDFDAEPWPGKLVFNWYDALTPEGARPLPPDTPAYLRRVIPGEALALRPLVGQEIELTLRLRQMRGLKNSGLWDIEPYWADQGVTLRAWEQGGNASLKLLDGSGLAFAAAKAREALRQRVLAALPKEGDMLRPGAELIPALLFGDKYLVDSKDAELFVRSTLAHSLALSGLHLGYAAALGYFAVFLLYRLRPRLALVLPRKRAAVIGGALPALLYLWLGGAPPSLVRSALMLAFVGWALFRSRPLVLADALLWAVGVILLISPAAAFDLRLQLSALCIAALAWAQPLFSRVYQRLTRPGIFRRILRGATLLFLSSLVIQLVLAPLLIKTFGLYGLAMPLNVIWLPVLGAVVMPCAFLGLGLSALGLNALAQGFFYLAALPCDFLLELLRWLDTVEALPALLPLRPHWLSMLAFWFLLLLASRRPSKVKAALALGLMLLPLLLPEPSGVRLRLLDVGQGQSVLVEWGVRRLLIDGGGSSSPRFDVGREIVAAELAQNRLPRLDYMLASHLDSDHAGGLLFPLKYAQVGYYADNGHRPSSRLARDIFALLQDRGLEHNVLRQGDVLELGNGLLLEVLYPSLPRAEAPPDGNRGSLVLRLVWQEADIRRGLALICGDVGKSAQREILSRFDRGSITADLLILPHHGSASSLLPEFYRAVAPRLALTGAGYGNFWNFPSPEVKNELLDQKIPLLSTALAGQTLVGWPGAKSTLWASTARYGQLVLER